MRRRFFPLISTLCLAAAAAFSQGPPKITVVVPADTVDTKVNLIEGNVIFVHEGDIISIAGKDGKTYSIRLRGIDAPERRQDNGERSRRKLSYLIEGMDVQVVVHKEDKKGRYIGRVFLDGQDISLTQIETGMAWHFPDDIHEQTVEESERYAAAELKARSNRIGLWESQDPMPPWDYRGDKKPVFLRNEKSTLNAIASSSNGLDDAGSKSTSVSSDSKALESDAKSAPHLQRTYILGPRGGCYYVGESGRKIYVKDKSLCIKQ